MLLFLLRYPWQVLCALLALGCLWAYLHDTPPGPAPLSNRQRRRLSTEIAHQQQALGADTTQANANHQAARQALDTARRYARQATHYHTQARHAPKPAPATATTAADVLWLQRQLSDLYR